MTKRQKRRVKKLRSSETLEALTRWPIQKSVMILERTVDPTRPSGMLLVVAKPTDRSHNSVISAEGADMSPTTNEVHIPEGMTLEHRPVCTPGFDERPLLRDREGHVMAAVEQWSPELGTTTHQRN